MCQAKSNNFKLMLMVVTQALICQSAKEQTYDRAINFLSEGKAGCTIQLLNSLTEMNLKPPSYLGSDQQTHLVSRSSKANVLKYSTCKVGVMNLPRNVTMVQNVLSGKV